MTILISKFPIQQLALHHIFIDWPTFTKKKLFLFWKFQEYFDICTIIYIY
jgi:hypothetical protein